MKLWKLVFVALTLVLVACVPIVEQYQGPQYSVSEIELLTADASERWVYFYGDPQTVILDGTSLELEPPPGQSHVWAVPGALWVSEQPVFREVLPALRLPARTISGFPFSNYYVETRTDLLGAWIYDGSWYRLTGPLAAGSKIKAEPRREAPRLENLTAEETEVILREILARNPERPAVLYQLSEPVFPEYRLSPRPLRYRKASLAVQYGVEQEFVLDFSRPDSPEFSWKVIARGAMSAYKDPAPYALLATSERSFEQYVWPLARGNRLPRPAPPEIDFDRQSVAAFFWGLKHSGGYSIDVAGVDLNGDVLEVRLVLKRPAPGMIVTQALTSPYVLIAVEGKPRLARFYDQNGNLLQEAGAQ